mgnify:CR=1 FL=1
MVKLSRYFLVIIAIVGFSIALPRLYRMAFDKPVRAPFIQYSCIEKNFLIIRRSADGIKRETPQGKAFTRDEYEAALPFMYARQLLMDGTMPDSVNGVAIDVHECNNYRSSFRLKPKMIHAPQPVLFPMFESESGRARLELPKDYFRISWRMEFIDAKTNKVNEEKSRLFSAALYHCGFQFPARSIDGLPTTRKSCDEGYIVTDNKNQIFHLKMVKGEPFVNKVNIPSDMTFKTIQCVDNKDKLYYAFLVSSDNNLYVLTQDDYKLVKLEVNDINPDKYEIRIYGDFFNFNVITTGDNFTRSQILNREYKKVDEYSETWTPLEDSREGKIAQVLFPAQLAMTNSDSGYVNFFVSRSKSFGCLLLSLALVVLQFFIIRKRKNKVNHILDFCLVAFTGIFGFIAVNIFPNKFWD